MLAAKSKLNRCRLSNIERGYVKPTTQELERLHAALDELIRTKAVIEKAAAALGWPIGEVR